MGLGYEEKTISSSPANKIMITQESHLCSPVIIFILAVTIAKPPTGEDPENVVSWNGVISYCPELENNKAFSFYTSVDI